MNRGLIATQEELSQISKRLGRKPFDRVYDLLCNRCNLILESAPITEMMWRSAYEQGRWGAATAAVGSIQGRIFDLIIAHKIERNLAYRDRAIEEFKNLLAFSSWVDPSHSDLSANLCTGEASATAAIALDLLADELTEADINRCKRTILQKGLIPYLQAVDSDAFWYSCYHNWNAVINCGVGLAGLLLEDEYDEGKVVLDRVNKGLKNFFNALGREGGWDEGLGYWGYAMRYVLLFAEGMRRIRADTRIFEQRGMDTTALFPIYFSPNGIAVSFGDRPTSTAWGAFYLFAKHYNLKEVTWWLDQYAFRRAVSAGGHSDIGLALLFRPVNHRYSPKPNLEPLKVYHEIGWAAMADQWPNPQLFVALKTGDLSAHHAQLDMNSIQVVLNNEIIIAEPGSPDFSHRYLSPEGRYGFYEVRSASHNTITIGEREQRIDSAGSIIQAENAKRYRWVVGHAGAALGENVRFYRHIVMPIFPKKSSTKMLIVLDEIHNAISEEITATWHSRGNIKLNKNGRSGTIHGQRSPLRFATAGSCQIDVKLEQRELSSHRPDNVIVISTPAVNHALLATVFATHPVGRIALRQNENELELQTTDLTLRWAYQHPYIKLEKVSFNR